MATSLILAKVVARGVVAFPGAKPYSESDAVAAHDTVVNVYPGVHRIADSRWPNKAVIAKQTFCVGLNILKFEHDDDVVIIPMGIV